MDLTMPRLSDTMEEGTLGRWLKQEGESIQRGEPIAEIQTDKANMELEAFDSGVLERIVVKEGETVPIGETIAVIRTPREGGDGTGAPTAQPEQPAQAEQPERELQPPAGEAPATKTPAQAREAAPNATEGEPPPQTAGATGRIKASPLARRIAQEMDIDLSSVRGTGPGGRIVREDVEKAGQASPAAPAPAPAPEGQPQPAPEPQPEPVAAGEVQPLTRLQRIIAQRMVQSKTEAPHFYVTTEVDMAKAAALRAELNALGGQQVSFNDLVVKGCALALKAFPLANASYTGEGVRYNQEINLGVAVATEDSLIVPAIRNADQKLLRQIAAETRELAQKARENRLSPEDLSGGTFTVSNLGMYGVDEFVAIINQPQAAILAVGAITEKPVVEDGQVAIGRRMRITLSSDHRVLYGAHAAEFLREIKRLLESPLNLGF